MNFLEFLGLKKVMDDTDTKNVIKLPVDYVKPDPLPPKPREFYRVGFTDDGYTTLTLCGNNSETMTLSMTQSSCEKLIKLLQATYTEEVDDDQQN